MAPAAIIDAFSLQEHFTIAVLKQKEHAKKETLSSCHPAFESITKQGVKKTRN